MQGSQELSLRVVPASTCWSPLSRPGMDKGLAFCFLQLESILWWGGGLGWVYLPQFTPCLAGAKPPTLTEVSLRLQGALFSRPLPSCGYLFRSVSAAAQECSPGPELVSPGSPPTDPLTHHVPQPRGSMSHGGQDTHLA